MDHRAKFGADLQPQLWQMIYILKSVGHVVTSVNLIDQGRGSGRTGGRPKSSHSQAECDCGSC